jgi:hypothetical protein
MTTIRRRFMVPKKVKAKPARPVHLAKRNVTAKSGFDREADAPPDMVFYEPLEFPVDNRAGFKRNAPV